MTENIEQLLGIMQQLRDPQSGCPWDRQQGFASIAAYTIEEAYEVADAIERGDLADLKDELGDLLLQVVFHAQLALEQKAFDFDDVVRAICEKMIRRHPHVFDAAGGSGQSADIESVRQSWESIKQLERAGKQVGEVSLLDDIPHGMAELQRACKLQKRAASAGFDWNSADQVMAKLHEETAELQAAMEQLDQPAMQEELGDLIFTLVNLARKLRLDPAQSLRSANMKFEKRFRALEQMAGGKSTMQTMDVDALELIWQIVKQAETEKQQAEMQQAGMQQAEEKQPANQNQNQQRSTHE